jgi:hypothetical protein
MINYKLLQQRGALNEAGAESVEEGERLLARPVSPAVVELVPESVARENRVMPVALQGDTLTFVGVNPGDIGLADKLRFILNKNVRIVAATEASVLAAIRRYYGPDSEAESVDSMMAEFTDTALPADVLLRAQKAMSRSAPAVRVRRKMAGAISGGRDSPAQMALPQARAPEAREERTAGRSRHGRDLTQPVGGYGVLHYVVEEGQRALMRRADGSVEILVGPRRVWRWRRSFQKMEHFVAHPGEFLIVRFRDGRQENLPGPTDIWLDPRVHHEIAKQDTMQLSAKEAVVVYSRAEGSAATSRRIEYGPGLYVPRPGEWLHTFSWHASKNGPKGVEKIPNGLVFQKLWLMPDQMYHDVTDVRTSDDALLTVRLMIFFELVDIERMLDTTHDPIGDFVNAATSDVVAFVGKQDFDGFKRNTAGLNELETYRQLTVRAGQCGYRINKVVYRGYGAPTSLQQMHDQAIEARTRLQLERATEQQAQDLENYKLDCQISRAGKRRTEQSTELGHDLEATRLRRESELRQREAAMALAREQRRLEAEVQLEARRRLDAELREHATALRELGVDLTAYLTQARADRVIELRGGGRPHVHLESPAGGGGSNGAK